MATINTVHCKMYAGGSLDTDWKVPDSNGVFKAGYRDDNKNWVGVIRFTLLKPASSVTFNFANTAAARSEHQTLRFKFATSEDETLVQSIENGVSANQNVSGDSIKTRYEWGTNASAGSYEATGKFVVYKNNSTSGAKTAVTFYKNFSAGTHYIYIWADSFDVQYNVMIVGWQNSSGAFPFSATYEELPGGVIYIDNGTSFDAYEIWIDNGTKWEQYSAYIDNGSGWDECG